MKDKVILIPAISVLLVAAMASNSRATKLAGEFLTTGFGARALGMGGAFVSVADDASAINWNPAGLVQMQKSQLMLMHAEQFGKLVDYNWFCFATPIAAESDNKSSGGIGIVWLRVSDIALTSHLDEPAKDFIDDNGNGIWDPGERRLWNPERVRWESDNEIALYLSYARMIADSTSIGVSAKMIWKDIAEISCLGFGLDAGLLHTIIPNWRMGLNLQDLTTTPLFWDGWYYSAESQNGKYKVSTKETIYPTLKIGTSYSLPIQSISGVVTAAVDCDFKYEGLDKDQADFSFSEFSGDLHIGASYQYKSLVRISAGVDRKRLSVGIGLRINRFGIDYALWRDTQLDNTHRISISIDLD